MKKYIIAACLMLNFAIVACSSSSEEAAAQKKKGYELKGKFKTFKGINKVELTEVTLQGIRTVDSTQIDEKGEFSFKGAGSIPHFYLIRYNNASANLPVYLDSLTHVEVSIDPENKELPYTMKGDKNNEEMQFFYMRNNESYKTISETAQRFRNASMGKTIISMDKEGGVYTVPCVVNGLKLKFIFDSGASDVTISLTEALFMLKNGYLDKSDIHGDAVYQTASGDLKVGTKIIIKEIEFGGLKLNNIEASIVNELSAPLLLGQTALSKIGKCEVDFNTGNLAIMSQSKYTTMPDSLRGSYESTMQMLFDERAKNLQKIVSSREPSAGALFCAIFLIPPPGQDQEQSMSILGSYLKEFEAFYVDMDKKHFERFGLEPSFASIHKFVKAQSSTAIGTEMENFTLNNPDGKAISLKDLRGKYVLVDFWASWCRPCRAENPNVLKAYAKYHSKGFDILGVSLDTDKSRWMAAIKSDGLDWNHVSELKAWDAEIARKFNVSSIPFCVLLDKDGKIIAKNLRGEALDAKLREIFGE